MAAISTLQAREAVHQIAKRNNWAGHEAGVIVVFCVVFIVAVGLIGLFIARKFKSRRTSRTTV
jgi:predicted Na+-dependent transporter